MPLPLPAATTHKPLLQRPLLQIPDKIPVIPIPTPIPPPTLLPLRPTPPPNAPRRALQIHPCQPVRRRRVVRRARLQADGLRRVEVACDALYGGGDAALLLLHC